MLGDLQDFAISSWICSLFCLYTVSVCTYSLGGLGQYLPKVNCEVGKEALKWGRCCCCSMVFCGLKQLGTELYPNDMGREKRCGYKCDCKGSALK